ncbi:SDR family NAD(P)-dependent oxidoreductase [Variovorax saccharolyticus]|uniref:SDR family NAD(P)-dependent oxidoreductase n=1 Tax=Variovorax saccharolyticus TaxID=3053516 RepID=UPI002578AAF5|nr:MULTISPECIES: glucose 1-dehydrogenase [unclassified Variovorax]MDM0020759.1 glucose 1-dehydrogenase [Variovorax sp. J22R187]MDM0025654.1 glucose 1-dehydrogenase [Variovorax sp. J31P216]
MFDLKGKVALVTGGNGGIGLGMAKGLAEAGARVVIAARNPQKSADAVEALKALGSDSFALAADVTDEDAVKALFDEAATRCGRLDILVNNAGSTVRKPVDQLSLAEWHQVMDTNLTSAFLCCRAAHPHLKAAGGGKIINIGSMMSIFGAPYAPAYGASKGGIVQLSRAMATSWAADGIQVNAVLPGWIQTELTDGARAQVPGLSERVVARTAAGRWGRPEDLAGIAVFLASAASDFVTGTAIPVDGGYSIAG